jgi:hypothetical protein
METAWEGARRSESSASPVRRWPNPDHAGRPQKLKAALTGSRPRMTVAVEEAG